MEAEFARAAHEGESHWFQGSADEMRVTISRSDDVCDRMLALLKDADDADDDDDASL